MGGTAIPVPDAAQIPALGSQDPGLRLVIQERNRQLALLNYTPASDDTYDQAQLWNAAHGYLSTIGSYDMGEAAATVAKDPPDYWPWAAEHWKPKGALKDLARAGALIAAEITRRIRAKERFVQLVIDAAVAGGADRPYAEAVAEDALDEHLKSEGIEVGCMGHDWGPEGATAYAEDLILAHLETEAKP